MNDNFPPPPEVTCHSGRVSELLCQPTREQIELQFEERTQELSAANEELIALNEEISAMNETLQKLNQQLEEEVAIRQQKEEELLLRELQHRALTGLLASSADAGEKLLEPIMQTALQLVGAPDGYIGLYNEDQTAFLVQYAIGSGEAMIGRPQPADTGLKSQALRSGQLVFVEDYQQYPHRLRDPRLSQLTSAVAVPLKQGDTVKGLLTANWFNVKHIPREEDLELLRQYADFAAIVILQADAREKIRRRNRLLSALAATTAALIGQLDLEESLKLILAQATQLIGVDHGFVLLFDEDEERKLRVRCGRGRYESKVGTLSPGKGITAQVLRTGKLTYIADYLNWPERVATPFYEDITLSMQAPLMVDGNVLGTFGLSAFGEPVQIDGEKLSVLEQFATVASIALKNALLFKKTHHLALHDVLTGLPNRAYLLRQLPEYLKQAASTNSSAMLLFIDLDDLKAINDNFGHAAGDLVIASAAARITRAVSPDSFVARIGGDEFVVVFPGESSRVRIAQTAETLTKLLAQEYEVLGQCILTSGSIGISVYPDDGGTGEDLLRKADNAMYAAKAAGRNCWRFFDPTFQQDTYKKLTLIHSLRRALVRDELFLQYQPKVETTNGKTVGFEALLRWQSPEHGLISPDRFIPLAEESCLILPIGKWVLQQACAFARRLCDSGRPDLHVAVNISPRQLADDDFIESVCTCVADAEIEPAQLELEVTESILVESIEEMYCKLIDLRDQGIRLALDDFGVGYSSLTYLRSLPLGTVKIDKSFIQCVVHDNTQATFVGHIIAMAHTLKLTVVAEGVETQEQWEKLQQLQCDQVQGYLVSRPVLPDDGLKFLRENG